MFALKKSLAVQLEFTKRFNMFERNELYILVDPKGLKREALFSGSDIVDEIIKRGNIIKPVEVNSFGDVHAFVFGTNGIQRIEYIPREFIKYFEMLVPTAVETQNILPFPNKPIRKEVPFGGLRCIEADYPSRPKRKSAIVPLDNWAEFQTEISNMNLQFSLVQAQKSLPIEQFPDSMYLNPNHFHLEARAS